MLAGKLFEKECPDLTKLYIEGGYLALQKRLENPVLSLNLFYSVINSRRYSQNCSISSANQYLNTFVMTPAQTLSTRGQQETSLTLKVDIQMIL